ENAVRIEPSNMLYLHAIANLLAKDGKVVEAAEAYNKVISSNYDDTDFYLDYAEFLSSTVGIPKSIELLSVAIGIYPNASALFYRLSAYNFLIAKKKEGTKWLEIALNMEHEGFKDFLDFAPELANNPEIINLIEAARPPVKQRRKKRQ
ncbi:MAG: hypothetical protein U1C46_11965, partial [Bacteroidales bacterium]|nr:hypothetical protein [Bacteroidales bacterium]